MRILTAIENNKLFNEIKQKFNRENVLFSEKNILYKEGIIELLEIDNNFDLILIQNDLIRKYFRRGIKKRHKKI